MKILFAAAEVSPFSKAGVLSDCNVEESGSSTISIAAF